MKKVGTVFQFALPNGWTEIQSGSRYIFHGPNREELIVSASLIQGVGTTGDLLERLFQNAEQSMKNAVAHPALKVTQPFQQNSNFQKVECWTLLAQTQDDDTVFYQAVFREPLGVLLATFEAPNMTSSSNAFEQFVKSVAVISKREKWIG